MNKITKTDRPAQSADLEPYVWSVLAGWLVMLAAGVIYARMKGIAAGVAIPIIAAFVLELPLYLAPWFDGARAAAKRMGHWPLAGMLAATAVLPYIAYSIPTGYFNDLDFFRLAGLATVLSFWYLVLPRAPWSDVLFLAAPAAVVISKILKQIYGSPVPHVELDILGKLMLIHVAALAVLVLRGLGGVKPGFVPTRREAWVGVRSFLLFLPVGFGLAWLLNVSLRPAPLPLWYAAPLFLGSYVVVAFSEEFAFRGVLQQHLARIAGNWPGLVMTSLLFGLSHLNFRTFPNWHMAELAGAAGLFYGWSYQQTGSIRSSMVTHALTAVVWSIWLR